jgi:hypothetical protein
MTTLEPLTTNEDGVSVNIDGTPEEIVERALLALDLSHPIASPDVPG